MYFNVDNAIIKLDSVLYHRVLAFLGCAVEMLFLLLLTSTAGCYLLLENVTKPTSNLCTIQLST